MRFGIAVFAAAMMLLGPAPGGMRLHAAEMQPLEIVTKAGVRKFTVEVAITDEEQERGLMYRRELAEGSGMLFNFKEERPISMWMKNTYVPLDMLFIRSDGTIAKIAENTKPRSLEIINSGAPVRAVVEVNAGTARKLGIKPGDKVVHPIFGGN